MPKTIQEILKTTDPNFLKEYSGYLISDPENKKFYTVENNQLTELPFNSQTEQQYYQAGKLVTLEPSGGLAPAGKAGYNSSEAFRYSINQAEALATLGAAGGLTKEEDIKYGIGGTPFRAINPGEDLTSYMKAKQAYELAQTGKSTITMKEPEMPKTSVLGSLGAGGATPFRARNPGEDLTSYLQAKQSYEIAQTGKSTITLGGKATGGETIDLAKEKEETIKNIQNILDSGQDGSTSAITGETITKPAAPEAATEYENLRTKYAVEPLETELADIDKKISDIYGLYEKAKAGEEKRLAPMAIIRLRQEAVSKEQQIELNSLYLRKSAIQTQLDSKYKTIDTLMGLEQTTYENARHDYEFEVNKALSIQQLMGEEKNNNRATLTAITNLLGNTSWDDIPQDMKTSINNMERLAGYPVGTIEAFMSQVPGTEIKWTNLTTDAAGNQIMNFWGVDSSGNPVLIKGISTGGVETSTGDILDTSDKISLQIKLSDKFNASTKDATAAINQIKIMNNGYEQAVADPKYLNAASQSVLVVFQKMLDPSSVVRESEYARSGEGLSLMGQMQGALTKLSQGGAGVSIGDLKNFVDMANSLYQNAYLPKITSEAQKTLLYAETYGLDINLILSPDVLNLVGGALAPDDQLIEEYNSLFGETSTVSQQQYQGQIGVWMLPYQKNTAYSGVWRPGYVPYKA